jgi:hypothetical protein
MMIVNGAESDYSKLSTVGPRTDLIWRSVCADISQDVVVTKESDADIVRHLPGETEENDRNVQSKYQVSGPK